MRFSTLALAGLASAAAPSICDKYTVALLKDNTPANQFNLVTLLVKTAALGNFTGPGTVNPTLPGSMVNVPGLLAPGTVDGTAVTLAKYFTGMVASTNVGGKAEAVNWLDNGTPTQLEASALSVGTPGSHGAVLFAHLVSYFGVLLGCSGVGLSGFPAYSGSNDMGAVHQFMDLSSAEFTWFIENVGLAAQSFGASSTDITAVATSLNTTFGMACSGPAVVVPGTPKLPQAICQGDGCPKASPAVCGAYTATGTMAATVTTLDTTVPATIAPATPKASGSAAGGAGAGSGSASGSASAAASSAAASSSAAAGAMATAAGHVLAAGALVAALL